MHYSKRADYIIFIMRIAMGWMLLHDGYTKLIDKTYSPVAYMTNATSFPHFYDSLASAGSIGWVTVLTIWGPLLLGIMLIIGFQTRIMTLTAAVMIALFYFPILDFPLVTTGGYIVDRHIIYILVLLLLNTVRAGEYWGLDSKVTVTVKT
jgi:uncharacterized membrane protein YphA (DoxX/SURF4 family)